MYKATMLMAFSSYIEQILWDIVKQSDVNLTDSQ